MAPKYDYNDPAFQQWVSQQPPGLQQEIYNQYMIDQGTGTTYGSGSAGADIGAAAGNLAGTAASGYATNALFGSGAAAGAGAAGGAAGLGAAGAGTAASGAGAAGAGGAFAGATASGTATGAGSLAATGSTGAATTSGIGSTAAAAAPYLAAAITAYQSFENYKAAKKAAGDTSMTDKEVSTIYSPWRSSLGKGAEKFGKFMDQFSPGAHIMKGLLGSTKGEDQIYRDRIRSQMKKNNFIDENYQYTNADGSTFDMGADGDHMLDNVGTNIDGKTQRHTYDVDFSNANAGGAVGALQGLGAIMAGSGKLQDQTTGMLTNSALQSGDPIANVMKMYQDAGLDHDSAYGLIHEMAQNKKLDPAFADAVKNGLDQLYGVGAYKGQGSQFGNPGAPGAAPMTPSMPKPSGSAIKTPMGMSAAVNPVRDPGMGTGQKPNTMPRPSSSNVQQPVPQNNQPRGATANYDKPTTTPRGALSLAPKPPTVKPTVPSALVKPKTSPGGTKEFVVPPGMTYEQYLQMVNAPAAPVPTKSATPKRLGSFGNRGN